jgi:hypothetical protein
MKLVVTLFGAVVGLLVVRGFFLDEVEEAAWRIFWERSTKQPFSVHDVLTSATFAKCAAGAVVGGLLAYVVEQKTRGAAGKKR